MPKVQKLLEIELLNSRLLCGMKDLDCGGAKSAKTAGNLTSIFPTACGIKDLESGPEIPTVRGRKGWECRISPISHLFFAPPDSRSFIPHAVPQFLHFWHLQSPDPAFHTQSGI